MARIIGDPVLDQVNKNVGGQLAKQLAPHGIGYALFLFRTGQAQQRGVYTSNARREEMVKVVGQWVDHERAEQQKRNEEEILKQPQKVHRSDGGPAES